MNSFPRSSNPIQSNGHHNHGGGASDPGHHHLLACHGSLRRCIDWLSSIPANDVRLLHHTNEYSNFLQSFERLVQAHHLLYVHPGEEDVAMSDHSHPFLQHAADEILLRIFDFLSCQSLVCVNATCSRFRSLAERNARRRSKPIAQERQLSNVFQMLRAREQIEGIGSHSRTSPHVSVPILLLSRRIIVTGCGDADFNGVYYCTGSNGNGFVFTKPRDPPQRVAVTEQWSSLVFPDEVFLDDGDDSSDFGDFAAAHGTPTRRSSSSDDLDAQEEGDQGRRRQLGQLMRCLIAKRFSNETILWYMSKEIIATEDDSEVGVGDVTQVFCFWAKLMVIGDASSDICRYPSQTSILARHGERWQTLSTTHHMEAPTVELLD